MAPVRFTRRLRLLPRQAKPSLHDRWRSTWSKCHWPWNVKSKTKKHIFSYTTESWNALENWCLPATFQFHFWDLGNLSWGSLFDHGSWLLFQSCNSCADLKWVKQLEQLGKPNRWQLAMSTSNSGTCGIGKNRLASKTSKTITAW